jgi:choline dehydrogenase-like flavoprotein
MSATRHYRTQEAVDFLIIGSGAAGGVMAKELATAGFRVVVLEQGPYLKPHEFRHDELGYLFNQELMGPIAEHPQTLRRAETEEAKVAGPPSPLLYMRAVGGSSVHFTGNYWRFHPIDFREHRVWGDIPGAAFADWPITYEELEPYYTKVDWEIGVSGAAGVNPFDPPRSRPYPVPPLPVTSAGVLLERGAGTLGLHASPAPMAILSRPHEGRGACIHCGFCMLFACEAGAKSSTLATMIPRAEATGRCEIRPDSTVFRIETSAAGRVTQVLYWDRERQERSQRARAVVLCANGAETARLLLLSTSPRFPHGLANGSGKVGKYLMFNGLSYVGALFDEPLNEFKSVEVTRVIHDFYDADPRRGFYGGGGIDARFGYFPILYGLGGLPPDAPTWGREYKRMLGEYFTRTMYVNGHTTSLPVETNSISLDPTVKDVFGRPALRVTYRDHPDDLATMRFLQARSRELAEAAGARRIWEYPVTESSLAAHLLGTCRMGTDPAASVVDPFHRTHEVRNLFICDGSSFVTSGRGQPTMTIQALAFRAAEHIAGFARRGEI